MGTTRIKVIDLSGEEEQIKASRKHAEKLAGAAKIKRDEKETKVTKEPKVQEVGTPQIGQADEGKQIENKDQTVKEVKTSGSPGSSVTSVSSRKHLRHQGKKYQESKKQIENKTYKVREAIELLPKSSFTKFDPAVEIHLNVAEKNIKGSINFPHQFSTKQKQTRYLIFSDKTTISVPSVIIIWGTDQTIADIESGKLKAGRDFDAVIATPKFMPNLAKIAKILGPRGMMPSPKNGTVSEDFEKVLTSQNDKSYQFKSDPEAPIIHAKIGKLSQKPAELEENLKTLILAVDPSNIKKGILTSTMGPPIKIDINSFSR